MKRILSTLCLAFALSAGWTARAQGEVDVNGVVLDDATGETIIGASVLVKGSSTGSITDLDGAFSFKAPKGQEIVVSSLGYADYVFTASSSSKLTIRLKTSSEYLEDVVVVGYGSVKRANLTGAVDQVSSEVFEGRPAANATQMLVGAIPNLNISLSDGKPSRTADFNIRGTTSVGGGGSALVLIDGVEGDPSLLNPDDIESVSVLKDAASASIYGSRATFGVVLITTKSASEDAGKFNFNYSGNISFLSPTNLPNIIEDGYVYASLFRDAYYNYYGYEPVTFLNGDMSWNQDWMDEFKHRKSYRIPGDTAIGDDGKYVYYGNTNYYKLIYKPFTLAHTHNLSASGTTGKLDYYLSGRLYKYDGILNYNPDVYQTTALRAKVTARPYKWLKIWENMSYNHEKNHIPASDNGTNSGNFLRSIQDNGRVCSPLYNPDGTLTFTGAAAIGGLVQGNTYTDKLRDTFTTTTGVKASFFDDSFSVNADFSYKINWYNNKKKKATISYSDAPGHIDYIGTPGVNDYVNETWYRGDYMSVNAYAEYKKIFGGKHDFHALLGYNFERQTGKTVETLRYGLLANNVESINLALSETMTNWSHESMWRTSGVFARINYAYDERYLLEINGRYDGSSKFPSNQQWGFFPSVSVAWRLSREHWWKVDPKIISNVKFRGSWGELGNGNVAAYSYLERFSFSTLSNVIDGEAKRRMTSIPSQIPDNLTWETSRTVDGGIDLGFFNGCINLSADYYVRNTLNMYTVGPTLPDTYGADPPKGNYADLVTRGFEVSLGYDGSFPVGGHNLNVGVKASLSDNRSFITRYNNPTKSLTDYYEGQEIGEIWGYQFGGFFDSLYQVNNYYGPGRPYVNNIMQLNEGYSTKAGDVILVDRNGNQIIDKGSNTVDDPGDQIRIANKHPRYLYSFSLSLEWNGIYASAMFQGVGKQDWYPSGESIIWGQYHRPYGNALAWTINNAWTPEHKDAFLPKYTGYYRIFFTSANKVDRYVMDASYLRLQNVQIGWNMPSKWFKKAGISGIGIYFAGENLFTWAPIYNLTTDIDIVTATKGGDVDLTPSGTNSGDGNSQTSLRTFSIGLTIKI